MYLLRIIKIKTAFSKKSYNKKYNNLKTDLAINVEIHHTRYFVTQRKASRECRSSGAH